MSEEKTLQHKILLVQQALKGMSKDQKGFNYKYYNINQLIAKLKPLLAEHGLLVMQPLSHIEGKPAITTVVASSGEQMEWTTPLPTNATVGVDKGGKQTTETDPQRMGAAITYYRRYALASLFLLEAEDTDAN
jgi:hypothetical protein